MTKHYTSEFRQERGYEEKFVNKVLYDNWLRQSYRINRSGYIMDNSPLILPQFLIVIVHFFVASNVARYNAFSSACTLGKTLRQRFKHRQNEFRLFYGIGCIKCSSDFYRKFKDRRQDIPVVKPSFHGYWIMQRSFLIDILKAFECRLFIWYCIDAPKIF